MSNLKFRLFFIFLAVGFIFIALDADIKTNMKYPHPYDNSDSVIGEFQYYNIASNYGAKCTYKFIDTSDSTEDMNNNTTNSTTKKSAGMTQTKVIDKVFFDNIHIDIFNDIIGFLLILAACFGFKKVNKVFSFAFFSAFCGCLLYTSPSPRDM